ncbi:MAG: hypothetical protein ACFFD2_03310 [Promethearchaeota archaeon]
MINSDLIERIKETVRVSTAADNEEANPLWFWGESAFPFFFYIIKILKYIDENELANLILQSIFNTGYLLKFSDGKKLGVANPYYNIQDLLAVRLGINPNKINFQQFYLSSYLIEILLLMIARRDERRLLEENWRKVSYFRFNEYIPDKVEDYFSWLVEDGRNHSSYPNQTQSWNELRDASLNPGDVPEIISKNITFLILFSIICPHRINKQIIISLENLINNSKIIQE